MPLKRDNSFDTINSISEDIESDDINNLDSSGDRILNSNNKSLSGTIPVKKKESRKLSHVFSLRKRKSIPEANSNYFKIIE